MENELMTVSEVAAMLRLNRYTIYRLASAGKLPSIKVGRALRFRPTALERYILSNERRNLKRHEN